MLLLLITLAGMAFAGAATVRLMRTGKTGPIRYRLGYDTRVPLP